MAKPVCIIGGGVAGMQVALVLSSLGTPSVVVEKSAALGGRVPRLSKTFPFFNDDGFNDGKEFTDTLERDLRAASLAEVRLNTIVTGMRGDFPNFITATELEWMLNPRGPTGGKLVRRSDGEEAQRLAIVFCVGSRNKRIGA